MADSPILKAYTTTAAKLSSLPLRDGNLIFVRDLKRIYLDSAGQRIEYSTIHTLDKESDRTGILAPVQGYYYVLETNVMWMYNSTWVRITPENINPIYFGDRDSFPDEGQADRLYVTESGIYQYNATLKAYQMIANTTNWQTLD